MDEMDAVHHFYTEHAVKYGVEEAILLYDIIYWIAHNAANGKHFHDGRYWTYNSAAGFSNLHPYWRDDKSGRTDKIQRLLNSLIKQGAILRGNYNATAYDRTSWYALSDELADSILQFTEIHYAKTRNGICESAEPIPNIKPDNKPIYKESVYTTAKPFTAPTIEQVRAYCKERNSTVDPQKFIDHYTSNGWMVGRTKMKDWKAAIRTWEARDKEEGKVAPAPRQKTRIVSIDEMIRMEMNQR